MSNKPQSRPEMSPEDLPTPDGLALQPEVHTAMDLDDLTHPAGPSSQSPDPPQGPAQSQSQLCREFTLLIGCKNAIGERDNQLPQMRLVVSQCLLLISAARSKI